MVWNNFKTITGIRKMNATYVRVLSARDSLSVNPSTVRGLARVVVKTTKHQRIEKDHKRDYERGFCGSALPPRVTDVSRKINIFTPRLHVCAAHNALCKYCFYAARTWDIPRTLALAHPQRMPNFERMREKGGEVWPCLNPSNRVRCVVHVSSTMD